MGRSLSLIARQDRLPCGTPHVAISYDKVDTLMLGALNNIVSDLYQVSFAPTPGEQ